MTICPTSNETFNKRWADEERQLSAEMTRDLENVNDDNVSDTWSMECKCEQKLIMYMQRCARTCERALTCQVRRVR